MGATMINILNIKTIINKERIYKRLHIAEGTEAFKNAESVFNKLSHIITDNMKITAAYMVIDSVDINFEKPDEYEKYIICLVSSEDDIGRISDEMISAGNYLEGYLLYEFASDVIFNTSKEMNKTIKEDSAKIGYKLPRRYAPGDGIINMSLQSKLLDALKKETAINVYLNEEHVLIPERSLLYMFGLKEGMDNQENINECVTCKNISCQYREIQ